MTRLQELLAERQFCDQQRLLEQLTAAQARNDAEIVKQMIQ